MSPLVWKDSFLLDGAWRNIPFGLGAEELSDVQRVIYICGAVGLILMAGKHTVTNTAVVI
jgi:hypothetical protein